MWVCDDTFSCIHLTFLSRNRTLYHSTMQNQTGKAILRHIFHRRYHEVNEERQGRKGSYHLGQYPLFVSTRPLCYAGTFKNNGISNVDDNSDLVVKVYQKHRIGMDKLVIDGRIAQVSGKLQDGGRESSTRHVLLMQCHPSARTHSVQ